VGIEFVGEDEIYIKSLKANVNIHQLLQTLLKQNSPVGKSKKILKYIINLLPRDLLKNWRVLKLYDTYKSIGGGVGCDWVDF
jgi:hypothetical protein